MKIKELDLEYVNQKFKEYLEAEIKDREAIELSEVQAKMFISLIILLNSVSKAAVPGCKVTLSSAKVLAAACANSALLPFAFQLAPKTAA